MKIKSFTFNLFSENTYVVYDSSNECAIIDPGCYTKQEIAELKQFIADNNLKPVLLLNTHCHVDHVLGNKAIADAYNLELQIHKADLDVLRSVAVYAPNYGLVNYEEQLPGAYLEEGKNVEFGTTTLEVIFCPGHAPGHVVFYHKQSGNIIGGDVLFKRSIGRTDLPGGDHDTLIKSIQDKLFILPDETVVHPGHGPETTIGEEKSYNPFCAIR